MSRRVPLPRRWTQLSLRVAGVGLLVAAGAIHLDLYLTGYRSIPTIGWMFLLQVITAFLLALTFAISGSWAVAAMGAGFAASTLIGYLLSVWVGLFGFKEVRTTAGIVAAVIEVATVAVLALYAVIDLNPLVSASADPARRRVAGIRIGARSGAMVVAGASLACLAVFGMAAAIAIGPPSVSPGGTTELLSAQLKGVTLLTDAKGFTLYWFALDSPTQSRCVGDCEAYWPPVTGSPAAGSGVAGTLGTIDRGAGVLQATFDGHPLYRYVGDTAQGQANGNGLNLNGGIWHEVTVTR